MQGTLWEWNVEKLEGVPSQILVTCPLQAVSPVFLCSIWQNLSNLFLRSWILLPSHKKNPKIYILKRDKSAKAGNKYPEDTKMRLRPAVVISDR